MGSYLRRSGWDVSGQQVFCGMGSYLRRSGSCLMQVEVEVLDALIEGSRASYPSGRYLPSFILQVLIIAGLNKLYDGIFSP